jgi:hypothetical protein
VLLCGLFPIWGLQKRVILVVCGGADRYGDFLMIKNYEIFPIEAGTYQKGDILENVGGTLKKVVLPPPIIVNLRAGDSYDEYIGLGSAWGNRFIGDSPRNRAISLYETRLRNLLKDPAWRVALKALSGKRLGCHCKPKACHGDVIIKLFLELIDGKLEVSNDQGRESKEVGQ